MQFKLWLLRAVSIARRRKDLRDIALVQPCYDLKRRLDCVMAYAVPRGAKGEKLRRHIGRCQEHLMMFVADRHVPPTSDVSEQALRPSVLFRKVANGFRAE